MIIDLLVLLLLVGGFVLGFFRGVVRQFLALGAWLVIFVGAAYLRVPLGDWLDASSAQFSTDYSHMLAFTAIYLITFTAGLLLVEFGGAGSSLTRHPLLDDAAGGVLGLVLAALFVTGLIVCLGSYFVATSTAAPGEVGWLRDIHRSLDGSTIVSLLREWVIRPLGLLLGPLLPADVRELMA